MARSAPTVQRELKPYMTTNDVAARYDTQPRTVLRMIREGRLKATKMGWVWFVHKDDLPKTWPPPTNNNR